MPGIVGLITKLPRAFAERELATMVDTLRHEPFYVSGTMTDEKLGVYVGWVAHEGSFSDGMPLSNEAGDVVLVFSGEEFPDPGTAARLKGKGHTLGPAEASYLVHLYEEDPHFPKGLNGLFHALLIDRKRGIVSLMNDRYNMQRLYYHESQEAFYFSAEPKAILAVRPDLRTVDLISMGELITLNAVLENRSLFAGISAFPGGSLWSFRNGRLTKKETYFQPKEWEAQPTLDTHTYYDELRERFAANLPRYFAGRQRVAMSLTGGLDTRAVMAWYKGPAGSLPCYTFGGTYRHCQDVLVARKVARLCGQPHHVLEIGADFLSAFPTLAERTVYLSDGSADVSCSAPLFACYKARQIAPVRITGNYGDQILRRYRAFKPKMPAAGLFSPDMGRYITAAFETYTRISNTHPLTFCAFRQTAWHHYSLFALERSQLPQRSPFLDNDLVRTSFRAPFGAVENNTARLRLIADGNPSLRRVRTDMGVGGTHESFPGAISRRYQTFTFKAEYAYDHGMPQAVAQVDHALSFLHLERLFLGRHKYYHFRVWYRDALSKSVRDILLDPVALSRPYLNRKAVEAMVEGHLKHGRNYTFEIHLLLSLELFNRLLIDHNISPAVQSRFLRSDQCAAER